MAGVWPQPVHLSDAAGGPAPSGPGRTGGAGPAPSAQMVESGAAAGAEPVPDGPAEPVAGAGPTAPALLGPAELRALAQRLDVRPTKQLGQNFVIDPNTIRRIVRAARLRPDDVVVEVGPGLGSLTL